MNQDSLLTLFTAPFRSQVTFGQGAEHGPQIVLQELFKLASSHSAFASFFHQTSVLTHSSQIFDDNDSYIDLIKQTYPFITPYCITLGGDHAITHGCCSALKDHTKKFSCVLFDAHADLRYSWQGSTTNHACVVRNLAQYAESVIVFGVRSLDKDEYDSCPEHVQLIFDHDPHALTIFKDALSKLHGDVYISIDCDVFNPAILSNTGTPEPGGLDYPTLCQLLTLCFQHNHIIGADLVEFAPQSNYETEARMLAYLIYFLGSMFFKQIQKIG